MKKLFLLVIMAAIMIQIPANSQAYKWRKILNKKTFDVAVNPLNCNTIYTTGDNRLLHRSEDGGKTWHTDTIVFTDSKTMLNNLMIDPLDTNCVFVSGITFGSIQRSTDRGHTWRMVLGGGISGSIVANGKTIIQNPDEPGTYYYGDYNNSIVFKSINGGATWDSITVVYDLVDSVDEFNNPVGKMIGRLPICSMGIRPDSTNILFVGSINGDITMSKDCGKTWHRTDTLYRTPKKDKGDCEITWIQFSRRDPKYGYAIITYATSVNRPNGGIWQTTDGGYNWHEFALRDTSLWALAVRQNGDKDEVVVGGFNDLNYFFNAHPGLGVVRTTFDGGNSWVNNDSEFDWIVEVPYSEGDYHDLQVLDPGYGLFGGDHGNLIMRNFVDPYSPSQLLLSNNNSALYPHDILAVGIPDPEIYYVGCRNGKIFTMTRKSIKAKEIQTGYTDDIRAIRFISPQIGFFAGNNGFMLKTYNSMASWNRIDLQTNNAVYSINFADSLHGMLAGENGLLMKTTNAGESWTHLTSGTTNNINEIKYFGNGVAYAVCDKGVILRTTTDGASWTSESIGRSNNITSLSFLTPQKGIICGDRGLVLTTQDAGATWLSKAPTDWVNNLYSTDFVNYNTGFIVGDAGYLLKTTDHGITWRVVYTPSNSDIYCLRMVNEQNGYMLGALGSVSSTTNGGETWTKPYRNFSANVTDLVIGNDKIAIATLENGNVARTTNTGASWLINSGSISDNSLNAIAKLETNTFIAAGGSNQIFKSVDAGANWAPLAQTINQPARSIAFYNSETGVIACDSGLLYRTTNAGASWTPLSTGYNQTPRKIKFFSPSFGLICAESGVILKSTNGGITWKKVKSNTTLPLYDMYIFSESEAIAIAKYYSSYSIKTTDGGETWQQLYVDSSLNYKRVAMINDTNFYMVASNRSAFMNKVGFCDGWMRMQDGYAYRQRINCWSLRYFGNPGSEKLYLASEGGLFVREEYNPVEEFVDKYPDKALRAYFGSDNYLSVSLKRSVSNQAADVKIQLVDMLGNVVYSSSSSAFGELFENKFYTGRLSAGVYICTAISGNERSDQAVIVE